MCSSLHLMPSMVSEGGETTNEHAENLHSAYGVGDKTKLLESVLKWRKYPKRITVDKGIEFTAKR